MTKEAISKTLKQLDTKGLAAKETDPSNTSRLLVELYPSGAITLSPYPRFTDECIFCYNCTTVCPKDAILADLSQIPPMLRKSAGAALMTAPETLSMFSNCSSLPSDSPSSNG